MDSSNSAGSAPVVVRFAPSPTGFLHIGGARTALFNWLYAKAKGGRFLLRIEDTDRQRNSPEAVAAILDGLSWLGLDWEGDPISQYERADRHREVAEDLVRAGHAYRCYLSPDELSDMRAKAEAEKRPLTIQSPWRDRDLAEAPEGVSPVIRLRAPKEGETVVRDHVQGDVTFPNKDLDDLIILRSDGSPTYNLAVVVDDHDMGITHVIRGVDHLTNAARQTQIFQLMNWPVPQWAHVPLIHGADGAKLSKRHGALGVEAYREMGYLPDALKNYLVRLGWSHGDDEIISPEQLVAWFDLDGIGKSPARFDVAKLEALNAHYIRQSCDQELFQRTQDLLEYIEGGDGIRSHLDAGAGDQLMALIPALKERSKTLCDIIGGSTFLWAERPLSLDDKAAKLLDEASVAVLGRLAASLANLSDWDGTSIEAAVRSFADGEGLKLGKVAQPLRAALTGSAVSPPIFDVMAVLGRQEAMARLQDVAPGAGS